MDKDAKRLIIDMMPSAIFATLLAIYMLAPKCTHQSTNISQYDSNKTDTEILKSNPTYTHDSVAHRQNTLHNLIMQKSK